MFAIQIMVLFSRKKRKQLVQKMLKQLMFATREIWLQRGEVFWHFIRRERLDLTKSLSFLPILYGTNSLHDSISSPISNRGDPAFIRGEFRHENHETAYYCQHLLICSRHVFSEIFQEYFVRNHVPKIFFRWIEEKKRKVDEVRVTSESTTKRYEVKRWWVKSSREETLLFLLIKKHLRIELERNETCDFLFCFFFIEWEWEKRCEWECETWWCWCFRRKTWDVHLP